MRIEFSRRDVLVLALLLGTAGLYVGWGDQPHGGAPPERLAVALPVASTSGIDLGARRPRASVDLAREGRFILGVESAPIDFGRPFDWGRDGLAQLTLYSLHSLEPSWQLRNEYLATGDRRALDLAIELALDYRARNPLLFPLHANAWGEHPTANRILTYLYLGELAREVGDPRHRELWEASLECAAYVARRSQWIEGHNHGLFVAAALVSAGIVMDRPDLRAIGQERFDSTWRRIVDEDFLLEHNPSYQMAIVELLERLALLEPSPDAQTSWRARAGALRNRMRWLAAPDGHLPRFGDQIWGERHDLGAAQVTGPFLFGRAGYLGWRGPENGLVVDLAAHSPVHSRNTASSVAYYDTSGLHGAYRVHAAFAWACPGMGDVLRLALLEAPAASGASALRIQIRFGADQSIARVVTLDREGFELRDTLEVDDPAACRMPVDGRARIEGGEADGEGVVVGAKRVVTDVRFETNSWGEPTLPREVDRFEQVRVQPFDPFSDWLRHVTHRIRRPGKPLIALHLLLAGGGVAWGAMHVAGSRRLSSALCFGAALSMAGAAFALTLVGALV